MHPVFFYRPGPTASPVHGGWRWWLNVWTPAAIAVAIICSESTDTFSANNTSSWLRPIVQHLFGPMRDNSWALFHHYLRKTGHFFGYGAVAFTFLRAWLYTLEPHPRMSLFAWRRNSTLLAIASTALVASCDEYHQTFIPSRTGTLIDVFLDTAGACVLCLLVWLLCWNRLPSEDICQGIPSQTA